MIVRILSLCVTVFIIVIVVLFGCSKQSSQVTEIKKISLDGLEGVITKTSGVELDKKVSIDGGGSLKITASEPIVIRLFETGDIDLENARLIYQAKLKTENVDGQVYLEMLCHFPGKGEYFSRALQDPLSGTMGWAIQETPFFLRKGENPDNVKLNLVVDGKGTAWIDDIRLLKANLQ